MSTFITYETRKLTNNRCKIKRAILSSSYSSSIIEEIRIPSKIDDCTVTSIGCEAFRFSFSYKGLVINKLIIPKTIVKICSCAFKYVTIKEVIFEDDSEIKEISDDAFSCTDIEKLDINAKKALKFGPLCFSQTHIKNLDLSKCTNIVSFGYECFSYSQIETVNLPSNIKTLGDAMFEGSKISDISFLSELKNCSVIPDSCFRRCEISKIPNEIFNKYYIGDYAFVENNFKKLELPEYARIGTQVFSVNRHLTTVISNMSVIPVNTFQGCQRLKKVIIKNAVEIQVSAFRFCSIKELSFEDNKLRAIDCYAFANNEIEELSLENNANLAIIEQQAFSNNNLKSVKLPFYLETIFNNTFENNPALSLDLKDCPFINIVAEK